jgi:hypothetical protein
MTGPNSAPTVPVPRRCTMKSASSTVTAIGSTIDSSAGVATFRPSTALSTEIAGVITLSP